MRAIIITKPTNLEQHGEVVRSQIKRGYLEASHLDELESAHHEHYASLKLVEESLINSKIDFLKISRGERWVEGEKFNFVISVGGDGTLLSASHRIVDEVPVIGIRSSTASVGYLCAGGFNEIPDLIERFSDRDLKFAKCARLKASIFYADENQERQTVPVLNDFLFANHNPSATTRYHISASDRTETHKSSGVWISTATGSSAGIMAAGGQLMERTDRRFQYKVRELYRGIEGDFSLTSGLFDPDQETFRIDNRSEASVLALDGQRGVIPIKFGDRITFKRAPYINIATPLEGFMPTIAQHN